MGSDYTFEMAQKWLASARWHVDIARLARLDGRPSKAVKLLSQAAILRRKAWSVIRPICGVCWRPAVIRKVDGVGELYAYCKPCGESRKHLDWV